MPLFSINLKPDSGIDCSEPVSFEFDESPDFIREFMDSTFGSPSLPARDSSESYSVSKYEHECLFRHQYVRSSRTELYEGCNVSSNFNLQFDEISFKREIDSKGSYSSSYSSGVQMTCSPFHLAPKNDRGFTFKTLIIHKGDIPDDVSKIIRCGPPIYDFEYLRPYPKILLFLIRLYLWESTPEVKSIKASEIWYRALTMREDFISYYNDFFDYSLRYSLEKDYEALRKYEGMDVAFMPSYSSLYPPRGILFYDLPKDDIEYMFLPSYLEEESQLEEFRYELDRILDSLPMDELIIAQTPPLGEGSSVSVRIDGNSVVERRYLSYFSKYDDFLICDTDYKAVRCHVPVDPSSYRDTVILDYRSSNTVRLIESNVLEILHYLPESAFGGSGADLHDKYLRLSGGSYACRDIKKCGLTMNKTLLRITLESLSSRNPFKHLKCFTRFFDSMVIIDEKNNKVYRDIPRGSGLGQANMLTTLIEIVIFRIAQKRYGQPVKGLIGNDDAIACAGWDFLNIWETVEVDHDQIYNVKKSFVSRSKLFFEEYDLDGWRDKSSLTVLSVGLAYLLPIREAKELICANTSRIVFTPYLLDNLISYHGYEFFPDEYKNSFYSGGWLDLRTLGLSPCLIEYDSIRYNYGWQFLKRIVETIDSSIHPYYHSKHPVMWYQVDWNRYRFWGKNSYLLKRGKKRKIHKVVYDSYIDLIRSRLPGRYQIPESFVDIGLACNRTFDPTVEKSKREAYRNISDVLSIVLSGGHVCQERVVAANYFIKRYPDRDIPFFDEPSIRQTITIAYIPGSDTFGLSGIIPSVEFLFRTGYTGMIGPYINKEIVLLDKDEYIYSLSTKASEDINEEVVEERWEDHPEFKKYVQAVCPHHREYISDKFFSIACPICVQTEEFAKLVETRAALPEEREVKSEVYYRFYNVTTLYESDVEDEEDLGGFEEPDDW